MRSLIGQKEKIPESWSVSELSTFYVNYRSNLVRYASRLLHDPSRAEEVVQDALVKVILASPELESKDHALGYMYKTVESVCRDLYRYEGRRPKLVSLDDSIIEVNALSFVEDELVERIAVADDAVIVRQALAMLSPAERTALLMWEIEGRAVKEIAAQLGIKEKSVRHTISRARASLRKVLSELVIDNERGLTALDLLSSTYKRSVKVVKESSKTAFSLILIFFAFFGFNSMPSNIGFSSLSGEEAFRNTVDIQSDLMGIPDAPITKKSLEAGSNLLGDVPVENDAQESNLDFPGLDKKGVPVSFTTADSSGGLGDAYFKERPAIGPDLNPTKGQLIKTDSGAANILILQSLDFDESGFRYNPMVSFGRDGAWVPLEVRVVTTEIAKQSNGSYLVTAYIDVESEVQSPIRITAAASGRDLVEAPRQVITRLVLDSRKTQVLAQAVYVVEQGVGA